MTTLFYMACDQDTARRAIQSGLQKGGRKIERTDWGTFGGICLTPDPVIADIYVRYPEHEAILLVSGGDDWDVHHVRRKIHMIQDGTPSEHEIEIVEHVRTEVASNIVVGFVNFQGWQQEGPMAGIFVPNNNFDWRGSRSELSQQITGFDSDMKIIAAVVGVDTKEIAEMYGGNALEEVVRQRKFVDRLKDKPPHRPGGRVRGVDDYMEGSPGYYWKGGGGQYD